jgi:hypothetical protein
MTDFLPPDLPVITPANADRVAPIVAIPHQWGANTVAFSPDGELLAIGHESLQVWSLLTGDLEFVLQGGEGVIQDAAFRPDGSLIATAAADGTVRLWAAFDGEQVNLLRSYRMVVRSVAFRPDGVLLAAGTGNFSGDDPKDNAAHVWDARLNWLETVLHEPEDQICVAFSPDGALLAAGEERGNLWLWDARTLDCLTCLETPRGQNVTGRSSGGVSHLAFSPASALLAAGGHSALSERGGAIFLWDTGGRALRATLTDNSERVCGVAFNPAGSLIASGGIDGVNAASALRLWEVRSGAVIATLAGHDKPIARVAFSPDGTLIASAAGDGALLWGARG